MTSSSTPRGWQLMPVDPTPEMEAAGWIDKEDVSPREIFWAMCEAAPPAPAPTAAPAVTDEMVARACEVFFNDTVPAWISPSVRSSMRAAIEAALANTGAPVREGWQPINPNTGRPCGHEYVRASTLTDPKQWQCALCGANCFSPEVPR